MKYKSVSIILPTLKETDSFKKAINMIIQMNAPEDIEEFIVVVCEKTKKESFDCIDEAKIISEKASIPLRVLWQKHAFFGGAIRDGFMEAKGSHVCMVTPDLDTAPEKLPEMIAAAKNHPGDIILATRWRKGGGFINYNYIKKVWNWCSQQFLRVLYLTNISDFTWGNQLAPTIVYKSINFTELKHPINMERVVIPLRLGIRFHEVPAVCHMPEDDETVNPLMANFEYLRPAFRWRFAKKSKMLRHGIHSEELLHILKGGE